MGRKRATIGQAIRDLLPESVMQMFRDWGKKGGSTISAKKAKASRANGKLGGRPRKKRAKRKKATSR